MNERDLRMGEWNNRRQRNMEVGRLPDSIDRKRVSYCYAANAINEIPFRPLNRF